MARRWVQAAVLALGLAACGAEASPGAGGGGESVGAQAVAAVESGAFLLDVRSAGEFGGGHVRGATNIPVDEVPARLAEIPDGAKVVVYCQSGYRSAIAAGVLREHGHEVLDLGGIGDWPNRGDIVR